MSGLSPSGPENFLRGDVTNGAGPATNVCMNTATARLPHPLPRSRHRLHGLDALRALALLLGVLLHASMSFLPGAQHFWIGRDSDPSVLLGPVFFAIHLLRMPLFFFLAGLFACLSLERLGAAAFARDRWRRIALPLLALWFPIIMLIVGALTLGTWATLAPGQSLPPAPKTPPLSLHYFPLAHLWFLYMLSAFYLALLPLALLARCAPGKRVLGALGDALTAMLGHRLAPLGLALVGLLPALALQVHALHAPWYAWFGVPTPDQSLLPALPAWVAFGLASAAGWCAANARAELLARWAAHSGRHLLLALTGTAAALAWQGLTPQLKPAAADWQTFGYAWLYAASCWLWIAGLVGAAQRWLSDPMPLARYLADASYWVYLLHLPFVMLLQKALAPVALPWPVKLALVLTLTLAACLGSYHGLVRSTWLGAWLNGRRMPRQPSPEIPPLPQHG